MQKSLLVDISNLLWRFFSTNPDLPQLTISYIASLAEQFNVDYCFCVMDGGTPAYRNILCDYKKQRRDKRDDDKQQSFFKFANKALQELQQIYVVIEVKGFECDDIIGYLAKNLVGNKVIISADLDFFQLISDTVSVYTGQKLYDSEAFYERFGFTPDKYIIYKSIVGDHSDNIKGVVGVGPKTAKKILKEVNTVGELFEYSEVSSDRLVHKISVQQGEFYKALAVIELPAPGIIEILGERLPYIYSEIRRSTLPFVSDWVREEIESNLQNVKNAKVI